MAPENINAAEFIRFRQQEGALIDPDNAEVTWSYGYTLDPYNLYDLSPEEQQTGRIYFARRPGSDVWVAFKDLPESTREGLWRKDRHSMGFPAGLAC